MALTAPQKLAYLAKLEIIVDALEATGGFLSSSDGFSKQVTDIRTAYDSDPATVTATSIKNAVDMLSTRLPSFSSNASDVTAINAAAAEES